MVRIAIPIFHQRVSPILDSCTRLLILDFDQGAEVSRQEISLQKFSVTERFNLIKKMNVSVIICCAISEEMDRMIQGTHIHLVCGIVGNVDKVLAAYLNDQLDDTTFHMPGYYESE